MSDLELLQAIENIAREIAQRPIKQWYTHIKALTNALRRESWHQNIEKMAGVKDFDYFDDRVVGPLVWVLRAEMESDDFVDIAKFHEEAS